MTEELNKIQKLNNENYFQWKFRMEMVLIKNKLWKAVTTTTLPTATGEIAKWKDIDDEARATLCLSVDDSQLCHIRNCRTANEVWCSLKNYHEKSTVNMKTQLMRLICDTKMSENGDMEKHLNEINELFEKLAAIGEERLSESWRVPMILRSLPKSYDILITALEVRDEASLTLNVVQSKLIEEYKKRRQEQCSSDSASVLLKVSDSFADVTCFFCQKEGHVKKDCQKYKKWLQKKKSGEIQHANVLQQKDDQNNGYNFIFQAGNKHSVGSKWIVDSGASCHIAKDKNLFKDIDFSFNEKISVANGYPVICEGKGTCKVEFVNSFGINSTIY